MRQWTPRGHSQGSAGFTLVELLVSLTLLGLISVALFGGFRFGTRAWEAGTAHADRLDEVQVVQGFLRGRLSQTMTPRHEGEEGKPEGLLTGDASVLRFTAPWLTSLNLGGLYKFELSLDRDGAEIRCGAERSYLTLDLHVLSVREDSGSYVYRDRPLKTNILDREVELADADVNTVFLIEVTHLAIVHVHKRDEQGEDFRGCR